MEHRAPAPQLLGRRRECEAIDRVLASLGGGQSRALVLRAEAGAGKSALLDYASDRATACRVLRSTGIESEMELAYAGLHQLCVPLLDGIDALPAPQAAALGVAFGLRNGDAPDRFIVGLAVLGLLADAAASRPLLCLVDDAQWLDRASAQVLAFVARRIVAESVGIVFAVREPVDDAFAGIEDLVLEGLEDADARRLLASVISGPLDPDVRDRLVAETRGNPLALIELSRGKRAVEIAGGYGMTAAASVTSRIEDTFVDRIGELPAETRSALLVAAVEPVGDPVLIQRAMGSLGIEADAMSPAIEETLIEFGARVRFRHPLIRSAVVRASPVGARRAVHRALAASADASADPDRRAWHLAEAAIGFDEEVAADLVRSARRAQARGGLAAGATFHARGAELTPDPTMRSRRALMAAEDLYRAGAMSDALRLLDLTEPELLDEHQRARIELVRAHVASSTTRGRGAAARLVTAARLLERHDGETALATYADAVIAALSAGTHAEEVGPAEVAAAVLAADPAPPLSGPARAARQALHGLAVLIVDGYAAAAPTLRSGLDRLVAFAESDDPAGPAAEPDPRRGLGEDAAPPGGLLQWLPIACAVARALLDDSAYDLLAARAVRISRTQGAFSQLPLLMAERASVLLLSGRTDEAMSVAQELQPIVEATGMPTSMTRSGWLATFRGDERTKAEVTERLRPEILERGEGQWFTTVAWQDAMLYNSLGRYPEALAATDSAAGHPYDLGLAGWILPERVEAAVRAGSPELGTEALGRLEELAAASDTDWARGLAARSAALVAAADLAEPLHLEAIERLGRTRIRTALARAHLLYGEWLRRRNRRVESREHLRLAHQLFVETHGDGFAERARRELAATGEVVHKPAASPVDELTAQERQIALLAASGSTNPEIGEQLFLSPRTVEWHLRKVFVKLDVSSRRQLARAMRVTQPAPA
ncbi:AAA family ATPase [Agromyces intestinalis]|uniref:AAA family ATPase n=1 Tax=Agromyces intestinalis TaxID=2592652 RepID=A0A5C1YCK9_9MICO|nr:LuxR family transcriptional regulator [Agromyces intestinalis]QEO13085.1 AAA family ATPase [Agromyces intestinalis]